MSSRLQSRTTSGPATLGTLRSTHIPTHHPHSTNTALAFYWKETHTSIENSFHGVENNVEKITSSSRSPHSGKYFSRLVDVPTQCSELITCNTDSFKSL